MKPVFASDDEEAKKTAQITLYRVLEIGLRLLSPFMPFITEELYQRLPRPKEITTKIPSIVVASYPDAKECKWKNEDIETEVEFVQKVAKSIRSARSDYNLPNKSKTEGKHVFLNYLLELTLSISFFNSVSAVQRRKYS